MMSPILQILLELAYRVVNVRQVRVRRNHVLFRKKIINHQILYKT